MPYSPSVSENNESIFFSHFPGTVKTKRGKMNLTKTEGTLTKIWLLVPLLSGVMGHLIPE